MRYSYSFSQYYLLEIPFYQQPLKEKPFHSFDLKKKYIQLQITIIVRVIVLGESESCLILK